MVNFMLIIIEQSLLYLPLVMGSYISFSLLKVPDLSIESAYVTGSVCGAYVLMYGQDIPQVLLLCMVVLAACTGGALVGLMSSLLTCKGRLPHLLSSIIVGGIFHGINQFVSPVYVSLSGFFNPLSCNVIKQYPELLLLIVITVLLFFLMAQLLTTQLGYAYAIYGNNPYFFIQYDISTSYVFVTGILLANALAGLSGYLFAQSNNFLELNMGYAKALFCITALILGKSVMREKPICLVIPIVGVFAYFILQQCLLKVGFNLKYFTAVQAMLIAVILIYRYHFVPQNSLQDNLGV